MRFCSIKQLMNNGTRKKLSNDSKFVQRSLYIVTTQSALAKYCVCSNNIIPLGVSSLHFIAL